MYKMCQFAFEHLQNHPELIERTIVNQIKEAYKKKTSTKDGERKKLKEIAFLMKVSFPNWINSYLQAQDMIKEINSRLWRAVIIKENHLSVGKMILYDGKEYVIKTITKDYRVILKGKHGTINPINLEIETL